MVATATYSNSASDEDSIKGRVRVKLIMLLAQLMTPEIQKQALELKSACSENWNVCKKSNQKLSDSNTLLVKTVTEHLVS